MVILIILEIYKLIYKLLNKHLIIILIINLTNYSKTNKHANKFNFILILIIINKM